MLLLFYFVMPIEDSFQIIKSYPTSAFELSRGKKIPKTPEINDELVNALIDMLSSDAGIEINKSDSAKILREGSKKITVPINKTVMEGVIFSYLLRDTDIEIILSRYDNSEQQKHRGSPVMGGRTMHTKGVKVKIMYTGEYSQEANARINSVKKIIHSVFDTRDDFPF